MGNDRGHRIDFPDVVVDFLGVANAGTHSATSQRNKHQSCQKNQDRQSDQDDQVTMQGQNNSHRYVAQHKNQLEHNNTTTQQKATSIKRDQYTTTTVPGQTHGS